MLLTDHAVLSYISNHPECGRSQIHVAPDASTSTVWRALRRLVDAGKLQMVGEGRATRYRVAGSEAVQAHLRTPIHFRSTVRYRKEFTRRYRPNETFYLTDADRRGTGKGGNARFLAPLHPSQGTTYARRVLEELEIDLSWASSRLDGNSYDLLETERLVRSGKATAGKARRDAVMILNHRDAIRYVVENLAELDVCATDIRCIHALLANQLISDPTLMGGLRRAPVSISRSNYVPLEDRFTLREEFHTLVSKAARITNPFEQSFFLLVHIPYLHPFAHLNKRTSRIASIIPLLKADLAPMSFFAINDRDYIRGLVGVYELNDVSLLREAFVNGYHHVRQALPLRAAAGHQPRKGRTGIPPLRDQGDPPLRPEVESLQEASDSAHDGRRGHSAGGQGRAARPPPARLRGATRGKRGDIRPEAGGLEGAEGAAR